jgi:tRNA dimethylallyltransferase
MTQSKDVAKPQVIALMGPTASGKTDLAIALHEAVGAELISVDSALVYRGMDIGTAKPTAEELARAPHRLIDIRDPSEPYSAADFCSDARREMDDILAQGKTPLLVGGTMLYFKALLEGLSDMPASDPAVRAAIEAEAESLGWPAMHAQLAEVDPETAASLHPNHSHRIARALEVYRQSGQPISQWRSKKGEGLLDRYDWVQLALDPGERHVLHARIAQRFDRMLEAGLIDEVSKLYARGNLSPDLPSIRAVGYRQVWGYLAGEYSYDEMRHKGVVATRQLAKRQLTWLRGWPGLTWLESEHPCGTPERFEEIVIKTLNCITPTTI